jgi:hypothetical protein
MAFHPPTTSALRNKITPSHCCRQTLLIPSAFTRTLWAVCNHDCVAAAKNRQYSFLVSPSTFVGWCRVNYLLLLSCVLPVFLHTHRPAILFSLLHTILFTVHCILSSGVPIDILPTGFQVNILYAFTHTHTDTHTDTHIPSLSVCSPKYYL